MTLSFLDSSWRPTLKDIGAHARQLAAGYNVISFDVFETLLYREGIFTPADLFLEIGHRSNKFTGLLANDFASLRVRAERDARSSLAARNREEVRLDEIYASFNRLIITVGRSPLPNVELSKLIALEKQIELEHLRPIASVKAFYEWAIQNGKTVVLVSDFYLSEEFISEALKRSGYVGHHRLFVSCDVDKTKHSGSLYAHFCKALGVAHSEVLHVGDNPWSDGARALQSGIAHLRVTNPTSNLAQLHGIDLSKRSSQITSAMFADQADRFFGSGLAQRTPQWLPLHARIGQEVLGPLLLGMVSWLYEEAERESFTDLFFCARDGLIMKRAFDLYQDRFGVRAHSHYLEVSRQVIYRARATMETNEAEPLFIQNWSKLSPAEALTRWGLDPADYTASIRKLGFASADDPVSIGDNEGLNRFRRLFRHCQDALNAANRDHTDSFLSYLSQSGLVRSENPSIVDIGWHGSLQMGLRTVLSNLGCGDNLAGRYLGLFLNEERLQNLSAAGYLFSLDGTPTAKALRTSPSLVELLHTAGHGSTVGYTSFGGETVAQFEIRPDEANQYRDNIGPMQESAIEFVSRVLSNYRLRPKAIAPEDAFRGLNRLLNFPLKEEFEKIGAWKIAANYGTTAGYTALARLSPEGYRLWNARSS